MLQYLGGRYLRTLELGSLQLTMCPSMCSFIYLNAGSFWLRYVFSTVQGGEEGGGGGGGGGCRHSYVQGLCHSILKGYILPTLSNSICLHSGQSSGNSSRLTYPSRQRGRVLEIHASGPAGTGCLEKRALVPAAHLISLKSTTWRLGRDLAADR
jgi:hypothetical protein